MYTLLQNMYSSLPAFYSTTYSLLTLDSADGTSQTINALTRISFNPLTLCVYVFFAYCVICSLKLAFNILFNSLR